MASELRLAPLEFTSTTDRVYAELRRLIISGTLAPGQALNEKTVADQLGVSRSPVREAFQRLVTERLLLAERNKSVTVKEFTDADIQEIYAARIAIELGGLAAARALSLVLMLGATSFVYLAAARLFGREAGLFACSSVRRLRARCSQRRVRHLQPAGHVPAGGRNVGWRARQ